jgi:hypothetical protein
VDAVNDQARTRDTEDNLTRKQALLLINRNVENEKRGMCCKVKGGGSKQERVGDGGREDRSW